MIDEPKEKATLRAYLALLTGSNMFEGHGGSVEIKDPNALRIIWDTLVQLGCKEELPGFLSYQGEVIINKGVRCSVKVLQLYSRAENDRRT